MLLSSVVVLHRLVMYVFQMRGAVTENALMPIVHFVLAFADTRGFDRAGMSATGTRRLLMYYCGACPSNDFWTIRQSL